jgi:hypothetical protein
MKFDSKKQFVHKKKKFVFSFLSIGIYSFCPALKKAGQKEIHFLLKKRKN